jgi:hypothetical protein
MMNLNASGPTRLEGGSSVAIGDPTASADGTTVEVA